MTNIIAPQELNNTESTSNLLSSMWRGDAIHQIATLKNGNFKNIPVESISDAIKKAEDFTENGFDVYFACAEFITDASRKASNALGAWGYWFDLDCGVEKSKKRGRLHHKKRSLYRTYQIYKTNKITLS